MPTYDYICSNCAATTEFVHSINGNAPGVCPACGAEGTLTKAFNPPTIHFKGSGWAKKDRSGGRPKSAKSSESTESSSAQGSDKGSDKGSGGEGDSKSASSSAADGAGSKPETSSGAGETKSSSPAASTPSSAD